MKIPPCFYIQIIVPFVLMPMLHPENQAHQMFFVPPPTYYRVGLWRSKKHYRPRFCYLMAILALFLKRNSCMSAVLFSNIHPPYSETLIFQNRIVNPFLTIPLHQHNYHLFYQNIAPGCKHDTHRYRGWHHHEHPFRNWYTHDWFPM